MKNDKAVRWLLNELQELEETGILDAENKIRMEQHYTGILNSKAGAQNYLLKGMLLLGALMIVGGMILLTAHNWDMFSKAAKLTITFFPFMLASIFAVITLAGGKNQACREVAALTVSAGISTLIALISQIYHTGGTIFEFLTILLALTLPLVYIFQSFFLGAMFPVILFYYSLSMTANGGTTSWFPFAYTVLWIPFAIFILTGKGSDGAKSTFRYMSLFAAGALLVQTAEFTSRMSLFFLFPVVAAFFLLAGLWLWENRKHVFSNPWLSGGYITATLYLLISFDPEKNTVFLSEPLFWMVWGIFACGVIFWLIRAWNLRNFLISLLTLLPFLFFLKIVPYQFLCMSYLILLACALADFGFRRKDLMILNMGIGQIVLLVIVRFFDSRYTILTRSVVFIVLGILFLVLNYTLSRWFRKGEAHENI